MFISSYGKSLLPVMVYLHSGAFLYGSALPKDVAPDLLVEKDVLVVTLHFRSIATDTSCIYIIVY